VLALRLLRELNDRFGAELGAWKGAMEQFRQLLREQPLSGLWGASVVFTDHNHAQLVDERTVPTGALLVLPLAPHLEVLAHFFALPVESQLLLFPINAAGRH
jgi:hypothetical protein